MAEVRVEKCSLQFENHPRVFTERIQNFLEREAFVDVTLVCDSGRTIKAHRTVLAAFSPFFENILVDKNSQCSFLVFNDISEREMEYLLEFIYKGKVDVPKTFMPTLLKAAKRLQIWGLEHEGNNNLQVKDPTPSPTKGKLSSPVRGNLDEGVKVINPFAVKQRTIEDSDLTCVEEDLFLPGPSEIKNTKEPTNSKVNDTSKEDDSDIEFIEENPAVVVVKDTQNYDSQEWFRKTQPKSKRPMRNRKSSSDSTSSDDSEIIASIPKRKKRGTVRSDSNESNTSKVINSNTEKKSIKEETNSSLTEEEIMKKSFQELSHYCVVCETVFKNIKKHIKYQHSASLRKKTFTCKTCSKTFFIKYSLENHKCIT